MKSERSDNIAAVTMQNVADELGVSKSTVSRMINHDFKNFSQEHCIHTGYRLLITPEGRKLLINDYHQTSRRTGRSRTARKGNLTKDRIKVHSLHDRLKQDEQRIQSQTKTITMLNENLAKAQDNMAVAQKLQIASRRMTLQQQKEVAQLHNKLRTLPRPKVKKQSLFKRIFRFTHSKENS